MIDTGSGVTLIPESLCPPGKNLEASSLSLSSFTGDSIQLVGEASFNCELDGQTFDFSMAVVKGRSTPLLGRDFLEKRKINWTKNFRSPDSVYNVSGESIFSEYSDLFEKSSRTIPDFKASLNVDVTVKPIKFRARNVSYSLKPDLKKVLQDMETKGVISPVDEPEVKWATPIVTVRKPDGSLRICGSYDLTLNKAINTEHFNYCDQEEIFMNLAGAKFFSKVDLYQAFWQIELDEMSKILTTINTPFGLKKFNVLPYGVSSAPGIFNDFVKRKLITELKGVDGFYDDVIISGKTREEHDTNLVNFLERCRKFSVTLNKEKSLFCKTSVNFLGYNLSDMGIKPSDDKILAVKNAKAPSNVNELRSFLGFVCFLQRFIPRMNVILKPLYELLKKGRTWKWTNVEQTVFDKVKQLLTCDNTVANYDITKELTLVTDACQVGVSAILFSGSGEGMRPVHYASRVTTETESRYSQFDREALAVMFGVNKFHSYLYGRKFKLLVDNLPLVSVFGNKKPLTDTLSPRIIRWKCKLNCYDYSIEFVKGQNNVADWLSRSGVGSAAETKTAEGVPEIDEKIFLIEEEMSISSKKIQEETQRDKTLRRVFEYVKKGWPDAISDTCEEAKDFFKYKTELSIHEDCLWFGTRLVIPKLHRDAILEMLHETHLGIVATKRLARDHFWFPGINKRIEERVGSCEVCHERSPRRDATTLSSWDWPREPYSRIHADHFQIGKDWVFLIIDAHSKWMDLFVHSTPTTERCKRDLRKVFCTYGLAKTLVTDNHQCFMSDDMRHFLEKNGVKHMTSAPHSPTSNGQAERAVQTAKNSLLKMKGPLEERIAKFLMTYRNTTSSTTGMCPAELMLGRKLRTALDTLKPKSSVEMAKEKTSKAGKPDLSQNQNYEAGACVWIRDFRAKKKWVPGSVVKRLGEMMYLCSVNGEEGLVRRHLAQIKRRMVVTYPTSEDTAGAPNPVTEETPPVRHSLRPRTTPDRLNYQTLGGP